jgi:CheY-like chemotaxis protein
MQQNLQTHGATNREQAIVKIQTHHYDLIFMDINMPIMNGLTATYLIRGMLGLDKKNLPIIALTSNGTDEDQIKSLKTGMNAHITKPF